MVSHVADYRVVEPCLVLQPTNAMGDILVILIELYTLIYEVKYL